MDPKTSAAERLASLQNAINMGTAPQYTPAGTPLPGAVADDHAATYTPPTLARAPFITGGTPVAPTPVSTPTPPPPPLPQPTPLTPPQPAYTPTPPMPQPLSRTIPQPAPQPQTVAASNQAFVPAQPAPQLRSRSYIVSIVTTIFVVIALILTGLLYLYGSTLLHTSQPTTATEPSPTSAPSNGFQVTESSVFEPNFDQQQSAGAQVNTDPSQMFDDSSLPPIQ